MFEPYLKVNECISTCLIYSESLIQQPISEQCTSFPLLRCLVIKAFREPTASFLKLGGTHRQLSSFPRSVDAAKLVHAYFDSSVQRLQATWDHNKR